MDAHEFAEWMAFDRIEPFGEQRQDARFAQVLALMANYMRKAGAKQFTAADFMPDWDGSRKTEPQDLEQHIRGLFKMHNAKIEASRT